MDSELRRLQELYIQESNAFLECLRQKVPLSLLDKKREKIKEISRMIDEKSIQLKDTPTRDPSSTNRRAS